MADGGGPKTISLRYPGDCAACGAELPVRTKAIWDDSSRTVTCVACPSTAIPPSAADPPVSVAGGSAQAEFERRHLRREHQLDARWGRFAGIAKFLSDDPQSTTAWAQGADGERRLAAHLTRLLGDRAVFLHDRKVGRANIDHLIVASSGVWVVDAKNYKGRVEYRNVAGWLRPADNRIYVGGRDKTRLATGLEWQVTAVRVALGDLDAAIHPAVCFTSSDWGWFAKPFRHRGVLVTWASNLAEAISAPGDLGPEQAERVATRLRENLKPAI